MLLPNPRRRLAIPGAVGIACGLFLWSCSTAPAFLDLRAGSKPWNRAQWTPPTAQSCPIVHPSVQPWIQPEILHSRVINKYSETAASPGVKSRRKAAEIEPLKALYALSVPADIVTFPVQAAWWLITLPIRAIGLIGFAGT